MPPFERGWATAVLFYWYWHVLHVLIVTLAVTKGLPIAYEQTAPTGNEQKSSTTCTTHQHRTTQNYRYLRIGRSTSQNNFPTKKNAKSPPYIAVFGSGHTRKQINSVDAVIHTQESPPHKRFLLGCSSPFMRLAELLTALRAWLQNNVCLVGENPTCSVPALSGCEGLCSYAYSHAGQ